MPLIEVRLYGRSISVRLWGRDDVDPPKLLLARLLGRLSPPSLLSRFGSGPKDRRLMPDVDIRETCLVPGVVLLSSTAEDVLLLLTVLPTVLLRLRIVTLGGMKGCPFLGDARGGVLIGAGSLDLAEWTRCSSLCI